MSKSSDSRRPLFAAGLAAVILAALLLVPISYPRVTGQRVSLSLAGVTDPAAIAGLAQQLRAVLHSGPVEARGQLANGAMNFTLEATVPASAHVNAKAVAAAFAHQLEALDWRAVATTTPIVEQVSGSVWAYARELTIRVNGDGKTNAQLETEIRQRLAEAGVSSSSVSVTREGDQRKITLEVDRPGQSGSSSAGQIELQVTQEKK